MNRSFRSVAIVLGIATLAVSCGPSATRDLTTASNQATAASAPKAKKIVAAIMGQPSSFISRMNSTSNTIPGASNLEQLVNASLTEQVRDRSLQPQLAEAVPTVENGLWKLLPDGRMETTWQIREGARWHDGVPLTSDDLVFTTEVDQNRELPIIRQAGYAFVEKVEAIDPRTVTVTWNRPYIQADTMFTAAFASPMPKHILGDVYATDLARFSASPYWGSEFIGTGPFTVKQWEPGAFYRLAANEAYVLGRPLIDEIEVRFILDIDTMVTNLVAGAVDLTMSRGFTAEASLQLKDQWPTGKMEVDPGSYISAMPQFINPSPPIVGNAEFRKALWYGTDRQQLADTIEGGMSSIANTYIGPQYAENRAVEQYAVKYDYDPRKAAQMIEGLGYRKGSDGAYRAANGERLVIEVRSHGSPIGEKTTVATAALWTALGVSIDPLLVLESQMRDREYAASFPGFSIM
jgi:peptide/nickel transport system substrate-binding protein